MQSLTCVLIVDDNETDRYVLRRRLRRRWPTVSVLEATDGQAAIELLEMPGRTLPDVIFLDINMPRMDGHAFLKTYFGEDDRKIPVVMMLTSSEDEHDRQQALRFSSVRVYAAKPVEQSFIDDLPNRLA